MVKDRGIQSSTEMLPLKRVMGWWCCTHMA